MAFRLVHEAQQQLYRLAKLPLLDLISYRHSPRSSGLPLHCVDGILGAMLLFGDVSRSAIDFVGPESSKSFCKSDRVGPAPALPLEGFLQERRALKDELMREASTFNCPEGCLLLWRAPLAMRIRHQAGPERFEMRPTELLMLFGHNYAHDAASSLAEFEPTFEGKTDSWGGHYYARDHDHR